MINRLLRRHSVNKTFVLTIALLVVTGAATSGSAVTPHAGLQIDRRADGRVLHAADYMAARRHADFAAMRKYRPGFAFWQHVFMLPDHSIAFGSAVDGRLLVTFPTRGDWSRDGVWNEAALADALKDHALASKLSERRDQVAMLLEDQVGPVLQNSTRGDALVPNAAKYGRFLGEWGAIYERFGVPGDIGLAQGILESGLSATRRSEADAIGICQWLRKNWMLLNHFSPTPIGGFSQTTHVPYCAAYLSVLATKYGSFIPALSEHNAGGTNVGRALINGERLGQTDVRARYLLGSKLARDLRALPGKDYADVVVSYGPRSYVYAEMVFGNTFNVESVMASETQVPIYAMRTSRVLSLDEIVSRTQLPIDEIRRFNPTLADRVPARATLYLPFFVGDFGTDVAFWRQPASPAYAAVLDEFLRLSPGVEHWDDRRFEPVLADFRRRFSGTNTEEGNVMATVLGYAMDQAFTSPRRALLSEFRDSERVQQLFERGVDELDALRRRAVSHLSTDLPPMVTSDMPGRNIPTP